MSNFIGSDSIQSLQIGAANNPNSIVQNEVYPVCRFPGSQVERRLTFSDPIRFTQSQRNVIEFVNEGGEVVFSFDTGNPPSGGATIEQFVSINIPATELSIQTIGIRWTSRGGPFQANFVGNIFVFDAAEMVSWG